MCNFYSRPCGRGDYERSYFFNIWRISTHAPAGGATRRLFSSANTSSISTHAPAGGATRCRKSTERSCAFLLTPLREGRQFYTAVMRGEVKISTHAPAGGATWSISGSRRGRLRFLLTPLREGRLGDVVYGFHGEKFLLTPLREGRLAAHLDDIARPVYFYSRPCGRGDAGVPIEPVSEKYISTHAPAGGATAKQRTEIEKGEISTHAPAGGATARRGRCRRKGQISTHAPAGGATDCRAEIRHTRRDFYSRPCGRGDQAAASRHAHLCDFYSRPCGRGDRSANARGRFVRISTHAPAGGATVERMLAENKEDKFLLTPLREGRQLPVPLLRSAFDFYSRPCGRGDSSTGCVTRSAQIFLLTPLREGRRSCNRCCSSTDLHFYSRPCGRGDPDPDAGVEHLLSISTHAPAGGATYPSAC